MDCDGELGIGRNVKISPFAISVTNIVANIESVKAFLSSICFSSVCVLAFR